jgi:hypothetical protein
MEALAHQQAAPSALRQPANMPGPDAVWQLYTLLIAWGNLALESCSSNEGWNTHSQCHLRADVFMEVFSQNGDSSGALALSLQAGSSEDHFERNQVDRFVVKGLNVGVPAKLSVWTKANGASADWAVDWVSIQISQENRLQPQKYYASFGQQWLRRADEKLTYALMPQHAVMMIRNLHGPLHKVYRCSLMSQQTT